MYWLSFLYKEAKEKVKRKKYSLWILLFGFFGILFPYNVFANDYSLTLTVQTTEQTLNNVEVSIYQVGNIDESGRLYFIGEFLERTENLNGLTASESKELASKLVDFVQERQIVPFNQQNTDMNGKVSFLGLEQGVYLLHVESVTQNQIRYDTSPTLVVIPIEEQTGESNFHIESKTEAVNLGDNENGSTVDSPSTYDSIWFYVILATASFFGIIAFVIYFLVKRKKKNQVTQ